MIISIWGIMRGLLMVRGRSGSYMNLLSRLYFIFSTRGCSLVILACNTASAKALRSIQQKDLPRLAPDKRVLGVIRPTVESLSELSRTGHIGILATPGTIQSGSYELEIKKMYPEFVVYGQSCPMWVPLVENNEAQGRGADYFVKKYIDELLSQSDEIDTIVLGCTHYPLLLDKIRAYLPPSISVVLQGPLVTDRLDDYLKRHPEIESRCSKGGGCRYLTTESPRKFSEAATLFLNEPVEAEHIVFGIKYRVLIMAKKVIRSDIRVNKYISDSGFCCPSGSR